MGRTALLCAVAALAGFGCGGRAAPPAACSAMTTADIMHALRAAPARVALPDGTPLSRCVARAVSDVDLQNLGTVMTDAADRLVRQMPGSDAAAVQLGYLIGAAQRGAGETPGVQTELASRLAEVPGFDGGPPARRGALARGRAAGRRGG
jgi:hypothetical protein